MLSPCITGQAASTRKGGLNDEPHSLGQNFHLHLPDLAKLLVSALVIVIVTKIQLVSDRLSALLIALPLTSLLAMIWMHQGGQSSAAARQPCRRHLLVRPADVADVPDPAVDAAHRLGILVRLAANCALTVIFSGSR